MQYAVDKRGPACYTLLEKLRYATTERRRGTISVVKLGVTIDEAAEITGIGRNTMRKLVEWGKLPVLKVGRKAIICVGVKWRRASR